MQPVHLLTQLRIQFACRTAVVGVTCAGGLQVAVETLEPLIEQLQIGFELMLAAVGDRQQQHGKIIQHRNQLVPVHAARHPFAHRLRLRLVAVRQAQVIQQTEQRLLDMGGHLAVWRLDCVGQGIGLLVRQRDISQRGRIILTPTLQWHAHCRTRCLGHGRRLATRHLFRLDQ